MGKRILDIIIATVMTPFVMGLALAQTERNAAAQTFDQSMIATGAASNPASACAPTDNQCQANVISYFRPSNFSFLTILKDDGKDSGGGWQESNTVLAFANNLFEIYSCVVRIGMPMRNSAYGAISPSTAAAYSAEVANYAAANVWPTELPQGIFCTTFKKEMIAQFKAKHENLGARIMNP